MRNRHRSPERHVIVLAHIIAARVTPQRGITDEYYDRVLQVLNNLRCFVRDVA